MISHDVLEAALTGEQEKRLTAVASSGCIPVLHLTVSMLMKQVYCNYACNICFFSTIIKINK